MKKRIKEFYEALPEEFKEVFSDLYTELIDHIKENTEVCFDSIDDDGNHTEYSHTIIFGGDYKYSANFDSLPSFEINKKKLEEDYKIEF